MSQQTQSAVAAALGRGEEEAFFEEAGWLVARKVCETCMETRMSEWGLLG